MAEKVPQWVVTAVAGALRRVGADASDADLEKEARSLIDLWNSPERPAHNVKYLANLLERLADLSDVTAEPATLKLAAAYLATSRLTPWEALGGKECLEPQRRGVVESRLDSLGVPQEKAQRVQALVDQATSGHVPSDDLGAQILFDAILGMLGTAPQRYAKYRELLLQEAGKHGSIPFLTARRRFIKTILGRPRLFTTPFAAQWADSVRENLQWELMQIEGILGDLTEEGSTQDGRELGKNSAEWPEETRLFRSSSDGPEDTDAVKPRRVPTTRRRSIIQKQADAPPVGRPDPHPDDTSTMEDFDDLFSHRRKRPSTGH